LAKRHIFLGALAGTGFDLFIDYGVQAAMGYVPSLVIRDSEGNYVWGVGLGDLLGALTATGTWWVGKRKFKQSLKDAGFGWLLALGSIKIAELYGYLRKLYPVNVHEIVGQPPNSYETATPASIELPFQADLTY